MNLFDVYSLWNIEPVKAQGCRLWDKEGTEYLDFYGGHAVISIGHSHPTYVQALQNQVAKIGFYSNSVQNSLQKNWLPGWVNNADTLIIRCSYAIPALKPMKMH